ncbi:MAG: hypothetical protein QMC36_08795 [Patescibacteria group bacterium]
MSSITPADGTLLASGTGITVSYAYSDDVLMAASPNRTFKLEKNDGSGNFADITSGAVSSSGTDASQSHFALNPLQRGAYRATFSVYDSAGNQAQKVSSFYVDAFSFSVSSNSVNIGVLDSNAVTDSLPMTVTITTVGAPFSLTLSGGSLSAGYDGIASWNGTSGYAF